MACLCRTQHLCTYPKYAQMRSLMLCGSLRDGLDLLCWLCGRPKLVHQGEDVQSSSNECYCAGNARGRQGAVWWCGPGGRAKTQRPAPAMTTATRTPRLMRPLPGQVTPPTYLLTCLPTYYTLGELHGAPLLCATSRHLPIGQLQGLLGKIRSTLLSSISCCNFPL